MDNKKNIFIVIIIAVLFIGILFVVQINSVKINPLEFNDFDKVLKDVDKSVVYVGEVNENVQETMRFFKNEYRLSLYSTTASLEDVKDYLLNNKIECEKTPIYIVSLNDEPIGIMDENLTEEQYIELLDKYLYNKIPESERAYKVLTTADDYIEKLNSKKYTVAVFGYEGCSYCNMYLPVFNEVASEHNVDIYYFDRDNYGIEEWDNIMDLDLEIPGECTLDGNPTTFLQSFPKPMTIITKLGKVEGCIRGYVTKDVLVSKLEEFKIIKEK